MKHKRFQKIQIRFCFILLILSFGIHPSPAQSFFVDNDNGAPGYVETGDWTLSGNPGYNGGTYRYTRDTREYSTATWTPDLPFDGSYEVYSIFRKGSDRTSSATYEIDYANGTSQVMVNMNGTSVVQEEYLGSFLFHAGTAGSVMLSNDGGPGVYIADTIRFRLVPPPSIEQTSNHPLYPDEAESSHALARITSDSGIASVTLEWSSSSGPSGSAIGHDDGAYSDRLPGDSFYGAEIPGFPSGIEISFYFVAEDNFGISATGPVVIYEVGKVPDVELILNEILASNAQTNIDPDDEESGDWFEIFNKGSDRADLSEYAISDNPNSATKWVFPEGASLNAGEYLVVWCDEENKSAISYHTNFKLSQSGEFLLLYNFVQSSTADSLTYGEQITDKSLARIPDLTGTWMQTDLPTPGAANVLVQSGTAPVFSLASGVYSPGTTVTITAPGSMEIRYTTDSSEPNTGSNLYGGPIPIAGYTALRARAYYATLEPSRITTASYFTSSVSGRTIPIMDLILPSEDLFGSSGIYTNYDERGFEWERKAHVVVMDPDGSSVHETDAGLRIHGGFSRSAAKKSLRLYFRSLYGQNRWSLPWIQQTTPVDEFQQLVLRAGGNDSFLVTVSSQLNEVTFIRDQIMRDWYADMGQRAADGFFVALHLNGQYWGLYNITERISDSFMEDTFGGEDWDIVKGSWNYTVKFFTEATDGDLNEWNSFLAWINAHDLSTTPDFALLKQKIGYENFLDFFVLNIFCQNEDWPHNNWISTKRRDDATSQWTFHEWDTEWGLGLRPNGYQSDTLTWAQGANYHLSPSHNGTLAPLCLLFNGNNLDTNRTQDINGILDHPEGEEEFIRFMEEGLNFELRPENTIPDFDAYVNLIQSEVPLEAARWESESIRSASQLISRYPIAVQNVRTFLTNRPNFIRTLFINRFGLGGSEILSIASTGGGTGKVRVNSGNYWVDLPWTGVFFGGSPVTLEAMPDRGCGFVSWSGDIHSTTRIVTYSAGTTGTRTAVVQFDTPGSTPLPNDVIFNEYWVNDDGTSYNSLGGKGIDGDWIELLVVQDSTDLRGWRVTNNPSKSKIGTATDGEGDGSLIFPDSPELGALPAGMIILLITNNNDENDAEFPSDDLDSSDRKLIFYIGNGNLDVTTDPDFGVRRSDEALVLLAPGPTDGFGDDIGIDFIAEGSVVTPASFGVGGDGVVFNPPFQGIGEDDGAVFTNDSSGGFVNDDASDPNRDDNQAGPGGWIVDPPAQFTGENPGDLNILTPGAPNTGQDLSLLIPGSLVPGWHFY